MEDGTKVVVLRLVQHGAFNDRAGGDNANDIPLHKAFRRCRVFHLLANGYLVPFGHKPCDIRVDAVERHAAHGRTLFKPAVLSREDQVQHRGHELCVIEEHLIKVSDPVH